MPPEWEIWGIEWEIREMGEAVAAGTKRTGARLAASGRWLPNAAAGALPE